MKICIRTAEMLSDNERYDVYRKMYRRAEELRSEVINRFDSAKNCELLSDCFIAVADEDDRSYFMDVEYKIDGRYNRIYRKVTEQAILKWLNGIR